MQSRSVLGSRNSSSVPVPCRKTSYPFAYGRFHNSRWKGLTYCLSLITFLSSKVFMYCKRLRSRTRISAVSQLMQCFFEIGRSARIFTKKHRLIDAHMKNMPGFLQEMMLKKSRHCCDNWPGRIL